MADRDSPTAFVLTHGSANPRRGKVTLSIIALTIARSLGRSGIRVVNVHPNRQDYCLFSKYSTNVEVCPDPHESETELVEFLLDLKHRYEGPRVLIPASDDCAHFVAKYRDQLTEVFRIPAPSIDVMKKIVDKKNQYEEAEKLGIPVPETHFPTGVSDIDDFVRKLNNYPYVIKPTVAHKWRLPSMQGVSKGKKGFLVRNPQELTETLQLLLTRDPDIMVQEVIGGRDERLFTFLSYLNEDSKPLGYCIRKKIRQNPIDFGYCTFTVSCFDPVVKDQSIRLLQGLKFHGICGVEWKLDPKNGEYKLIEINARAVNTTGIAAATGVDIPLLAFSDAMGYDVTPLTTFENDVKWLWFAQDMWAARSLHRAGELSVLGWLRSIAGRKVHALFAIDDLRPFLTFYRSFLLRLIGTVISRRRIDTLSRLDR